MAASPAGARGDAFLACQRTRAGQMRRERCCDSFSIIRTLRRRGRPWKTTPAPTLLTIRLAAGDALAKIFDLMNKGVSAGRKLPKSAD
jgi:hypothetical protein